MKRKNIFFIALIGLVLTTCIGNEKLEKKGFQINEISEDEEGNKIVGIKIDSLIFETRPRNVLSTYYPSHRLTPIYKVNYTKEKNQPYTGTNYFHSNWLAERVEGNNWNYNFMPGFKALYGYNLINISHYNNETNTENKFFENPVLIKTLYFPSNSKDTLNYLPINRNYYMISVYDEDTNKDGYINTKDFRKLYYFDINANNKTQLIPNNYSVTNSEYDTANDYMYIFTKRDKNKNGIMEVNEPINIFRIDLKNPKNIVLHYKS